MRTLSRTRSLARQALPRRSLPSAARSISVVPRVAEASLWKSVIPKAFRRENRAAAAASKPKTPWLAKEWNPATFYIVIFLLIGSMAIQMISLRNNFTAFTRRADVRIGLLREVIERIQNGEEVDVEKVLGSGDTENEAAWEQSKYTVWTGSYKPSEAASLHVLTENPQCCRRLKRTPLRGVKRSKRRQSLRLLRMRNSRATRNRHRHHRKTKLRTSFEDSWTMRMLYTL